MYHYDQKVNKLYMNTDQAESIRFCVDNFDQSEISVRILIKSG